MSSRRRKHVQLFAARLAHMLNASDEDASSVQLNYGVVYDQVVNLLARHPQIRDDVVGLALFPGQPDAEDAANVYFDRVLDRPMGIAPGKKSSVVFELLEALLRRSVSRVLKGAEFIVAESSERVGNDAVPLDVSIRHMRAEIARLEGRAPGDGDEVQSQPYVRIGNIALGLPSRLSIWDSIVVSPPLIEPIRERESFLAFCARVINAIETANRHYFELLNLGLYPPDWMDDLPVNQARAVGRLCRKAQEIADQPRYGDIPAEVWEQAWEQEKVPTFKTIGDFLESPLGRALVNPTRRSFAVVEDDILADESGDPDGADILDAESFSSMLGLCREKGVIDAYETELLERLFAGETLETLKSDPIFQERVGKQGAKIERYMTQLTSRLVAFARSRGA